MFNTGVHCVVQLAAMAVAATAPKAPRVIDRVQAFDPGQHLVATYYFNWYIDGGTFKYRDFQVRPDPGSGPAPWTWQPYYPRQDEPGAAIFGLDNPALWPSRRLPNTAKWPDSDDWLYHVAELRAMKWVGVDFAFVDIWWPHDFVKQDTPEATAVPQAAGARRARAPAKPSGATRRIIKKGSPCPELAALFRAWRHLDQLGEDPIKLAMMLETPSFSKADVRGAPLGNPDLLFEPIWAFYRQFLGTNEYPAIMPRRAMAAVADAKKRSYLIAHLFYPRAKGEPNGEWISRWDAQTFRDLRSRFEGMTGYPLYLCVNQHLHGPMYGGWDGVQAAGDAVDISRRSGLVDQEITWHASLAGPRIREDSIAIGYGYFKRHGGDRSPGGHARDAHGFPVYPRAFRYLKEEDRFSSPERQWQEVLSTPECFKKHLLVLESWNELMEGTQLAPARPDTCRDEKGAYVDRWGDSPTAYLELTRKYVSLWKGREVTDAREAAEKAASRAAAASQPAKQRAVPRPPRRTSGRR